MESAGAPNVSASRSSHPWRAATVASLLALSAMLALFRVSLIQMAGIWYHSPTYGYCLLVLPVAAFLAWDRRHRLQETEPRPFYGGLLPLFALSLVWLVGGFVGIAIVQHVALILMVQALAWTMLGTRAARAMILPLAFLIFLVPFGEALIPMLQEATAWIAEHTVRLSGIPIWRRGTMFYTPGESWYVAEACGGMRFFLSSIVLGIAFAAVAYRSLGRRVTFVVICAVASILANGVRAYTIVVLTHLGKQSELAKEVADLVHWSLGHRFLGFFIFLLMMAILFWMGWLWRETPEDASAGPSRATGARPPTRFGWVAALAILVLIPASATGMMLERGSGEPTSELVAPQASAPWRSCRPSVHGWKLDLDMATRSLSADFLRGFRRVRVQAALVAENDSYSDLRELPNLIRFGNESSLLDEQTKSVRIGGEPVDVFEGLVGAGNETYLVWSWFVVDGACTTSPLDVKWIQTLGRLRGDGRDASFFALSTRQTRTREEVSRTLQDFLDHATFDEP